MKTILTAKILICALLLCLISCSEEEQILPNNPLVESAEPAVKEPSLSNARISASGSQLTNNFKNWLQNNGYGSFNFAGNPGESYGGKLSGSDPVNNHPVIFIHGNGDQAVGTSSTQSGWTASIDYFLANGYRSSELYAITWGSADLVKVPDQYHSKAYILRIRRFIEAVKAYTGANKVDVIGHSMGVTLARKAIKGGTAYDRTAGGNYNVGARLTFIDTFLGIAGANLGLTSCYYSPYIATCDDRNGFYPGYLYFGTGPYGASDLLRGLNNDTAKEGTYVYSIWSTVDEVIGGGTLVYGKSTCKIPRQNGQKVFNSFPYGHFGVKDKTPYYQLRMVKNHSTN